MTAMKPKKIVDVCRPKGCPVTLTSTNIQNNMYRGTRSDFKIALRAAIKTKKGVCMNFLSIGVFKSIWKHYVSFSVDQITIGCYHFKGKNRTALLKWAGLKAR